MRLAIAVLLLAGCAVGQVVPKHFVCPGSSDDIASCWEAVVGDCYRVNQDGTLEKVDWCGTNGEIMDTTIISGIGTDDVWITESVDVPAITEKVLLRSKGDYWSCGMDACIADHDMYTEVATCADKSRILLTAEDGKHWCHKPQP